MIRSANKPKTCLAWASILGMALVFSASTPRAETSSTNKIHNIKIVEQKGKTVVYVEGSERPSFTAFKLSSPKRLVIDLADSQIRGVPSVMDNQTHLIDGVAVSQYSVKGVPVSRVMINFKEDVAYRIRVKGKKLVASLSGSPGKKQSPNAENPDAKSETAMKELAQLRDESSRHQAEAERAKQTAKEALSKLKAAQNEAEKAKTAARIAEAELRATRDEAAQAKAAAKKADSSLSKYKERAQTAKARADRVQSNLRSSKTEVEKAKQEALAAQTALMRMRKEVEKSKRDLDQAEARYKETQQVADTAKQQATAAGLKLAALNDEIEQSRRAAAAARSDLQATRAAASKAEKEAEAARRQLSKIKQEAVSAKQQARKVESNLTRLREEAAAAKTAAKQAKGDLAILKKQLAKTQQDADRAKSSSNSKHRENLKVYQREIQRAESEIEKYREKVTAATAVAEREKSIREKLERELAVLTHERDNALTEKERVAREREAFKASQSRLEAELERYKRAAETAEAEARKALKAQVAAAKRYNRASKGDREELLEELRAKERETVVAKKKATSLQEDFNQAKVTIGRMQHSVGKADQKTLKTIQQKLEEANRRYEEARREASVAARRADSAKAEQEKAEKAIAKIRSEADDFKTRAEAAAQIKVAEAKRQLQESREKAAAAGDKLKRAEEKLASFVQNAESAETRAKSLQQELAQAKQTISTQEERIQALEGSQKRKLTQEEKRLARLEQMRGKKGRGNKATSSTQSKTVASPSIKNIEFVDEDGVQKVVIQTSSPLEYALTSDDNGNTSITFKNAKLSAILERTLDVTDFGGIIGSVSSFQEGKDVKIRIDVERRAKSTVDRKNNTLAFAFQKLPLDKKDQGPLGTSSRTIAREDDNAYTYPFERTAAYTGKSGKKKKHYTGRHIDLDFKDADIHNILRLLSDVGHVNIITGDDVSGTVTIRMRDVAWDHALDIILQAKQLGMIREGNLIRVAPLERLEKEREMEIARRQQQIALEPLETRLIPISYATANELMPRAQDLLSERGKLSVDARTNVIIARDTKDVLNQIEALIRNLDTQTPQVLIEGRIVEATSMYAREIGIQWGGDFSASSATGNPTGLIFPNTIGLAGGATDSQTPTAGLTPVANGQPNPNFGVNMPAPVGTNSGGALGITLGSISNNANLSLRLSAMEETGTLRILSSPKILTLDNREATIEQGTMIPYSQISAQGIQTAFKEAKLNLTVTPHVTADGAVLLKLQVNRDEPDFNNTGARGDPTILKRQAQTELLVSDGHTAVIGGIFTRNAGTSFKKVPFFADIPIIGWLFKKKSDSDRRSEMLIFITPRIVNRAESIGS